MIFRKVYRFRTKPCGPQKTLRPEYGQFLELDYKLYRTERCKEVMSNNTGSNKEEEFFLSPEAEETKRKVDQVASPVLKCLAEMTKGSSSKKKKGTSPGNRAQRLINLEIPVLVRSLKSSNVELG